VTKVVGSLQGRRHFGSDRQICANPARPKPNHSGFFVAAVWAAKIIVKPSKTTRKGSLLASYTNSDDRFSGILGSIVMDKRDQAGKARPTPFGWLVQSDRP